MKNSAKSNDFDKKNVFFHSRQRKKKKNNPSKRKGTYIKKFFELVLRSVKENIILSVSTKSLTQCGTVM